jgi:regulator of chromosome condensation
MQIKELKDIKMLSAGPDFVLALDQSGIVYAWGSGLQDQLGRRIFPRRKFDSLTPRVVPFPRKNIRIRSIHAGSNHSFAIDTNGDTWAWGLNNYAQTGITDGVGEGRNTVPIPRLVPSLVGKNLKMMCGGTHHTVAITNDGACLVWGRKMEVRLALISHLLI